MTLSAVERSEISAPSSKPSKRGVSVARTAKKETIRGRLIDAAAKTIGKYGYAGCTIARVTKRARVAHGAFYLHFKSQQELFDQLLPALSKGMLEAICQAVKDSKDVLELERTGLAANFDYIAKHPYMHRVTTEAELYAPQAFRQFMDDMTERYKHVLERSFAAGQMTNVLKDDLDTLSAMLVGMRFYLLLRFTVDGDTVKPVDTKMFETYLRFVAHGFGLSGQLAEGFQDSRAAFGKPQKAASGRR